jgi:CdiI immunity protein
MPMVIGWLRASQSSGDANVTTQGPHFTLGQFFGEYVHQDFADFHSNTWETVEDFVANEPLEDRQAARSELGQLLAN